MTWWAVLLLAIHAFVAGCDPTGPEIIPPGPYTPGQSYFGQKEYIEYIAGDSPVILTATHGGDRNPDEIPDRTVPLCGPETLTKKDLGTLELVLALQQAHNARFGTWPHVVISHLHRSKLDANRELEEAACGDPEAQLAWLEFQAFLTAARDTVLTDDGRGWYMDMHGHAHAIERLELGYLLTGAELRQSDETLDGAIMWEQESSIDTASRDDAATTFSQLLRGPTSLGELYVASGFPSVPSATDPAPKSGESYFNGGYNTEAHACGAIAGDLGGMPGGNICGVQIEVNSNVRNADEPRMLFATATAAILEDYLAAHWDIQLAP